MHERMPESKQAYAEEVGLYFEHLGLTRMAGRILGWLMVCDPPHQTINELADALQASKGSISTMTRALIQMGIVERFGIPGQRRDLFRVRSGGWAAVVEGGVDEYARFRQLAERGLGLLEDEPPEARARLEDMRDVYGFFEREMPGLIEKFKQERQARQ
ncbi:GbsR/MarR family transcriptional regulator [Aggregatilinea lenta]|uniref:GbsR/MarR family transcriptional regulator n=1 Tax=Aggregatilinea lenta TaxID=913108 RepID=UPI001EE92954|nr:MarR family transcriptional regulator [Aggregatilinea lenta]